MNVRSIRLMTFKLIIFTGVSGRGWSPAPQNSQLLVKREGKKAIGMRSCLCRPCGLKRGTAYAILNQMTGFDLHHVLRRALGKRGDTVYPALNRVKETGFFSSRTVRTDGTMELFVDLYRRAYRAVQIGTPVSVLKVGG